MQIVSGRFIVALHLNPLPSYLLRLAHWQPSEDKNTLLLPECLAIGESPNISLKDLAHGHDRSV